MRPIPPHSAHRAPRRVRWWPGSVAGRGAPTGAAGFAAGRGGATTAARATRASSYAWRWGPVRIRYTVAARWNWASAAGSSGAASGCRTRARARNADVISSRVAEGLTPSSA